MGNIGKVYEGSSALRAQGAYYHYINLSKNNVGRAAGEQVSLWRDNEPIEEYEGNDFELG